MIDRDIKLGAMKAPMVARPPSSCLICLHPDREKIDLALLKGTSQRQMAKDLGIGPSTVSRHMRLHIKQAIQELRRNFETREISRVKQLSSRVEYLLQESLDILDAAREAEREVACPSCKVRFHVKLGEIHARVAAARQVGKTLELVGRISGEISTGNVNQFLINLGVKSEAEVQAAVKLYRQGDNLTMDDCYAESIALLEDVFRSRPDLRDRFNGWVTKLSTAEVVTDEAIGQTQDSGSQADPPTEAVGSRG